eukprot:TRINITY_DN44762_c0_g1_i1.p3 TRINITY_DN44762_c0_g1~~TRINITY_DN44762_c0_g1_i1.p3  ORF type:complete len:118 (+),score=26.60 TRINITY_DN44762_c0_g1_i1:58-411(+)
MKTVLIVLLVGVVLAALLPGALATRRVRPLDNHRRCVTYADCACGAHIKDDAAGVSDDLCFVGHRKYVTEPKHSDTCRYFCFGKMGEKAYDCVDDGLPFKVCKQVFTDGRKPIKRHG